MASKSNVVADEAIYYPYVHIRDLNWLKATLLVYQRVHRMVPMFGGKAVRWLSDDPPFLSEYSALELVCPADLMSERVQAAQLDLLKKLRNDAEHPDFQTRFGYDSARKGLSTKAYGFQVRQTKFAQDLLRFLARAKLAWSPRAKEPLSTEDEFVEVHPRLGQALMSTLAVACAQSDGLDIVADTRSEALHRCLATKNARGIYRAWLGKDGVPDPPLDASGEELFEFIVKFGCDLSALNAISLLALGEDRQPIRDLLLALREKVENFPGMDRGARREEYFHDVASDVLKAWRADKNNLPNFWKAMWSRDGADVAVKFVEKTADRTAATLLTGAGGAAAAKAVGIGGAALGGGAVAASGLVVGGLVYVAKTAVAQRKRATKSNYRFLTAMTARGVVIHPSTRGGDKAGRTTRKRP